MNDSALQTPQEASAVVEKGGRSWAPFPARHVWCAVRDSPAGPWLDAASASNTLEDARHLSTRRTRRDRLDPMMPVLGYDRFVLVPVNRDGGWDGNHAPATPNGEAQE